MKIQLFFENQEVELNDKVSFPLNKSFENLWNPTDIIVEYSKSIKIPATAANNKLMMNAYRIDRQFVVNDNAANIGMNLDPLKRIPMKLIYNGNIMLDGYAKYISSTVNAKQTYYTFNLYGVLGDIFQTLLDCVVDENKLTEEQKAEPDGGAKYVIPCPWEPMLINKDFVKKSWEESEPNIRYNYYPFNCIGMAPAYRGLYDDFESTSIYLSPLQTGEAEPRLSSVEDYLKKRWKTNLINNGYTAENAQARVDALDYSVILPNGLYEHNMRQFRSYEQKPYIYVRSLIDMYRDKCKELTGYTVNLDPNWFNVNNPYYINLCYMLDYLSVKGNTLPMALPFTGYYENSFKDKYCTSYAKYEITDPNVLAKGNITIDPFTLMMRIKRDIPSTCVNQDEVQIKMKHRSWVTIDISITTGGTTTHKYFWGGTGTPSTTANVGPATGSPSKYPNSEYIYMTEDTQWDKQNNQWVYHAGLTTKSFEFAHTAGDSISIQYNVQFGRTYVAGDYYGWSCIYRSSDGKEYSAPVPDGEWGTDKWLNVVDNPNFKFIFPNVTYNANWRTTTTCELKNLYSKDEPLFNVILQYTKMFGLIWKPNYTDKTIDIMTRQTYFKDYSIDDWTDKIDKSKGLTIEPVSFNSKYVTFNYNDVDGYRYSGYKNKYGVDYGEKKLKTKYNFDTKETNLFKEKIGPSSISCKSFTSFGDLTNWDTLTKLPVNPSEVNFIDCENEDQTSSISLNNWYFRLPNKDVTEYYMISDVSPVELADGKYYWVSNLIANGQVGEYTQSLPQFSPVFKSDIQGQVVGCLFNCPNEDYTVDKDITTAKDKYIYDLCWNDYINERYNANNKKVTAYVRLLPHEFEQFNFKSFVVIDNQLFIVNKIFDYDVNNETTKVEFIQVTNIDGYVSQRYDFPVLFVNVTEIDIYPTMTDWGASGSASVIVKTIADIDWDIVPIEADTTKSRCWVEDAETTGYETSLYITYESDEPHDEKWEMHIIFEGEILKRIPITI